MTLGTSGFDQPAQQQPQGYPAGTLTEQGLMTCMYFPRVNEHTKVSKLFIKFRNGDTAILKFHPAHTVERQVNHLTQEQIAAGDEPIITIEHDQIPAVWHGRLTSGTNVVGVHDSLQTLDDAMLWVLTTAQRPLHHLALQEALNRFEDWKLHAIHAADAGHTPVMDTAHAAGFGASWVL